MSLFNICCVSCVTASLENVESPIVSTWYVPVSETGSHKEMHIILSLLVSPHKPRSPAPRNLYVWFMWRFICVYYVVGLSYITAESWWWCPEMSTYKIPTDPNRHLRQHAVGLSVYWLRHFPLMHLQRNLVPATSPYFISLSPFRLYGMRTSAVCDTQFFVFQDLGRHEWNAGNLRDPGWR